MPWTFNPFSGTFDQKGSGGGSSYLEGEVQNFSALPTTTPPAVDAAYLVREAEGTWLLNRKPAGIYIRVATTGTRATDWQYAGEFPDVFNDSHLVIFSDADSTKNVKFDVSAVATGTTRTITVPNRNVALPDQDLDTTDTVEFGAIGIGTAASGKKLNILGSSDTSAQVVIKGAQWFGSVDGNQGVLYQGDIAGKVKVIALNDAFTAYKTLELVSDGDTFTFPENGGTLAITSDNADQFGSGNATDGYVLTADGSGGAAWEAATGGDTVSIEATAADILSVASGAISAEDAGADRIVYWNNTNNKLAYGTPSDVGAAASGSITSSGLTQATARILGRTTASTGAVEELSASDVRTFLNVADGANAYTHPNHTGDVTSVGDGATTIAANSVTYAKMQDISATSRILGRKTAAAGDTEECTLSEVLDFVGSAAQGDILYRGASTWTRLAAGTNGHYLQTKGSGANPEWAAVTASGGGATNLWIPASAWIPRTTSGCGVDSVEIGSTNRQNLDQLLFDTGSEEFAQALVVMPSNYNNSTLTARFYWTASSGSGGVAWGISGRAFGDDDAIDQATGTRIVVTDTLLAANDVHVTSATSAVTIDGTPAANKAINFQISRVVADSADTLAVDARFLGAEIIFN